MSSASELSEAFDTPATAVKVVELTVEEASDTVELKVERAFYEAGTA